MARPLRIEYPGAFYHITSRGNERRAVFISNQDRIKFLHYLGTATERYNARVHVYCLMDNHYHLLLETPQGNLSRIMRHINGAYTTYFNVKRNRSGHLFQGRYKSILVEKDAYAKALSRYIHLNPVRANLASAPQDYQWSSYNQYVGTQGAYEWLVRDFILGCFGNNNKTAQSRYHNFVSRLVGREYENPLDEVTGSVLLGNQDFVDFIKARYLVGLKPSKDIPAIGALENKASIRDICNAVDRVVDNDSRMAKNIKIFLCHKHTGQKLSTIGEMFGIGDSAVAQASMRFRHKIEQDKQLMKKIWHLEKTIKTSNVERTFGV